jgi:hypothetical protein
LNDTPLLPSLRVDSLIARLTPADVVETPFPHVVIHDALYRDLCDRLTAEFPPLEAMEGYRAGASNRRLNYYAKDAVRGEDVSPLWREIVARHVSQVFLEELLGLFADSIARTYPALAQSFAQKTPRAGVRWKDTFESADILLEAQPAANTPVISAATSVRGGHLDNPDKLVVGLYYLRHPEDDSSGGDLQLCRYVTRRRVFEGHEIASRYIEPVKTIPYQANTLVLFLNSPDSLHAVTPRHPTPWPRLFLNLDALVAHELFAIPTSWNRRIARSARKSVQALAAAIRTG